MKDLFQKINKRFKKLIRPTPLDQVRSKNDVNNTAISEVMSFVIDENKRSDLIATSDESPSHDYSSKSSLLISELISKKGVVYSTTIENKDMLRDRSILYSKSTNELVSFSKSSELATSSDPISSSTESLQSSDPSSLGDLSMQDPSSVPFLNFFQCGQIPVNNVEKESIGHGENDSSSYDYDNSDEESGSGSYFSGDSSSDFDGTGTEERALGNKFILSRNNP